MEKNCFDHLIKKQKIRESIAEIFQENGMSYEQGLEYCKILKTNLSINWISVLYSDWFSGLLFQYLSLEHITALDSSICNRNERPQWLNCLENRFSTESLESPDWSNELIDWIIARKLRFDKIEILEGYTLISDKNIYRMAKQWPNLRKLAIFSDIEVILENDKNLQCLLSLCHNLVIIYLSGFTLSFDHCVLLGACEQLERITITRNKMSTIPHIKHILKNKKKLKYLDIGDICSAEVLSELGTNCLLLEELHIFRIENILATHINVLVQGCIKLIAVVLSGLKSEVDAIDDLINMLIEGLGNNCHLLERFVLHSKCNTITELALKSLAQGCPVLSHLCIDKARTIPIQGVKNLVDYCPNLSRVDISNSDISDEMLVELGKSKCLSNLGVVGSRKITDAGINALVKENGRNLSQFDIRNCRSLTDASLSSISDYCPNLRWLTIGKNHEDMTTVGLIRLIHKCQKLCYCFMSDRNNEAESSLINQLLNERR